MDPAADLPGLRSAHARYARRTAAACGYAFRSLDGEDGYLFEVTDGPRRAVFSAGAGSPYALNAAHSVSIARDKAFTQAVLAERGLPTIPSRLFFTSERWSDIRNAGREPADARAWAASARYPLFCKPIDGAQGAFAEVISDAGQFDRYLMRVSAAHYAILAQPFIQAPEHRVFVLGGEVLFAYAKMPAVLTGDGESALMALLHARFASVRLGETPPATRETLRGHDEAGRVYGPADIAPFDAHITLEGAANRALGGGAAAPSGAVRSDLRHLALSCAKALGLHLCAVDVFDRGPDGLVVIEVNGNPAIKTLEDYGRWDLIETIWRSNFEAALA